MMDGRSQPSAKPRKRRKDARPAEIIAAGLREFADKGFAATRLEDVAARAGIVKGTIYRYFPSKEALFDAALRSQAMPAFDRMAGLIDTFPGSTADLLRLFIRTAYGQLFATDLSILVRIILSEGSRHPAIAELYHQNTIAKGRELISRIIERGIARGELRRGPATELPIVIASPMIMAMVWKTTFDRIAPVAVEQFLDAHLDLVLNGLEVRPPS